MNNDVLDVCFDGLDVSKDSFVISMEVCVLYLKIHKKRSKINFFGPFDLTSSRFSLSLIHIRRFVVVFKSRLEDDYDSLCILVGKF